MNNNSGSSSRGAESIPLEEIPLHSTNLLTLLDESGTIQYESPAIERIYGFDQNELVGTTVTDYFHPDDREDVIEAFRRVVESDEYVVEAVEYRHRQADGTFTWVESVASATATSDGYYVINTRDISDRKRRERDLEQSIERFEEFANVVSHDLRSPLSVALGNLELAEENAPSEHHSKIRDALERIETLIEDLLTKAQVETQEPTLESVDLSCLSKTCWQNISSPDATLTVEVEHSIRADRSRTMQLLENLYRNAVEHGGSDVTVTVGELSDGFYIEDDGSGIPEEERDRIFEIGYSNSPDSTGFGLAIVQRVADSHDWEIRVTDGSAGGARFEVTAVDILE